MFLISDLTQPSGYFAGHLCDHWRKPEVITACGSWTRLVLNKYGINTNPLLLMSHRLCMNKLNMISVIFLIFSRSFGVLLWEVFSLGYVPYPGHSNHEVMELVTAGERLAPPQSCPASIYHIMTICWKRHPDLRPNFHVVIGLLQQCLLVIVSEFV